MSITPGLQRALEAASLEMAAALKSRLVGRIQALLDAVEPALSTFELTLGLGLEVPKRSRTTVVSRWLSTSPRNLRAVPDEPLQALFEWLFEGEALMAIGPTVQVEGAPARRQLAFCEPWEVARLGEDWRVVQLTEMRTPARVSAQAAHGDEPIDWSGAGAAVGEGGAARPRARDTGTPPRVLFDPELPLRVAPRRLAPGIMIAPLGLGAMRLSTASRTPDGTTRRPDPGEAVALLRRALELGLRLIDTADSYALDDRDMHHNELLIRRALDGWSSADRDAVVVATKAGLVRPNGRWAPNGRPEHLKRTAEASLRALGGDALALLQLHVKDPRVPFEDSLGALADLFTEGKAKRLGICNASTEDLATALRTLPEGSLVSVQNELNPFDTRAARGIVAMTRVQGLTLLAHSPLGGHAGVHRVMKKDVLAEIALRHGRGGDDTGRHQVVLAWLLSLGPHLIPIFGATRTFSVESSLGALQLELTPEDLAAIDRAFPKAAALRDEAAPVQSVAEHAAAIWSSEPLPEPGKSSEVVMILGMPGAGKSTLVDPYVEAGYVRLNRDELGGKLDGLVPYLRSALALGPRQVVLDNTYPTVRTRAAVLAAAHEAGVPVRCLWLDTPLADARWNAVLRMLHRHGRLLAGDEIAVLSKSEANTIPPIAQAIWTKNFEPPTREEGFAQIERRAFVRYARPERRQKALLLDVDGTLRLTRSGERYPRDPADVELRPGRREVLRRWHDRGYQLYFVSNQSGVASGKVSRDAVEAAFERTIELLDLPVTEVAYCPHQAFPVSCFCRKPMPGLAVMLIERHALSLSELVIVGDMRSDAELAAGLGVRYFDAEAFFAKAGEHAGGTR